MRWCWFSACWLAAACGGSGSRGDATPAPVCGNGVCEGERGELCATCYADCKTTAPVCGNGACDPGEDSTSCYADCGPQPWPWTADEASLVAAINAARTSGTQCPGGSPMTAPALSADGALQPGARENAWEIAHQGFFSTDGSVCNGRTLAELEAQLGFTSEAVADAVEGTTPAMAVAAWLADPALCPLVTSPSITSVGPAVAHDLHAVYVARFR